VGSETEEAVALDAGLEDETEVAVLEVADAAVDEAGGAAGGAGGEVLAFDEGDAEAAEGGIAGDTGAGDAAADDEDVEFLGGEGEETLGAGGWRLGRRGREGGDDPGVGAAGGSGRGLDDGFKTHDVSVMAEQRVRQQEANAVRHGTHQGGASIPPEKMEEQPLSLWERDGVRVWVRL
jgi:hypothetical protein